MKAFQNITTILVIILILGILLPYVKADELITDPLEDLLPSREDIPTQWHTGSSSNTSIQEPGFLEGKTVSYNRIFGDTDVMVLYISVYRFSNATMANEYCDKEINEIKSEGGYSEITISGVFAVIIDYGTLEEAISWGVTSNIVFTVKVINTYYYENPTDELIYFTNLENNIVPEFSLLILLIFIMISTLLITIGKPKSHLLIENLK